MNYHTTMRTLIGSLVSGRYYPNKFPQETGAPTWPAIRGTVVSSDNAVDQCGAGGQDEEDVSIQIDVCATTYEACAALFAQVCTALAAASPSWIRQPGGFETWDAEAKVHRITRDWVLQQSTPAGQ